MDGNGNREPDYLEVKATKTADGYICEASLAYKNVKKLEFKAGKSMGFHPCFDDAVSFAPILSFSGISTFFPVNGSLTSR